MHMASQILGTLTPDTIGAKTALNSACDQSVWTLPHCRHTCILFRMPIASLLTAVGKASLGVKEVNKRWDIVKKMSWEESVVKRRQQTEILQQNDTINKHLCFEPRLGSELQNLPGHWIDPKEGMPLVCKLLWTPWMKEEEQEILLIKGTLCEDRECCSWSRTSKFTAYAFHRLGIKLTL